MNQLGVRMVNIDFLPLFGGAQMHTMRLARYLSQHGVDVQVITRGHPGLPQKETIDGVYDLSHANLASFKGDRLLQLHASRLALAASHPPGLPDHPQPRDALSNDDWPGGKPG